VARFSSVRNEVPASVNKYLLPEERQVIITRQHPAVLLGRTLLVLAGLAIAGWLSISVSTGNARLVIWILWGILVLWLGAKVWNWAIYYFVVTSRRIMLAQGVLLRRVNFIPLDKVTDVEFRRSQTGRLLGYGELEVMTPGQDAALRHIRFLPYPEQMYLEVCELLFRDREAPKGTGRRCPECAMDIPAAARLCPYCRTRLV
jgi:membrane protein YdbS with pleckstrin-like domain